MTISANRYNAALLIDRNLEAGRGDKIAVLSQTGVLTYRELFDRVVSMGSALKSLGCQREDRVLLVLNDLPAFPVAFFGAMRIGAVPVPVNPLYKAADFRFFLEDSYARIVVTDSQSLNKVRRAIEGHTPSIEVIVTDHAGPAESDLFPMEELLASHAGEQSPEDTHADDMAFWLYSSGSTGPPKGVVHLHRAIPATCETFARHVLQLSEDDILFGRALFHAYGLGNALTFPLTFGGSTILMPGRSTRENILDTIERFRPTIVGLVPTLFNLILNEQSTESRDLSPIEIENLLMEHP